MSEQAQPDGDKYRNMLAEVIARGEIVVPLSQCGLVKSGAFSIITIQNWIDKGVFPFIKIGFRRYTADSVVAQWISDGQSDPSVFGKGPPPGHNKSGQANLRGRMPKKKLEQPQQNPEGDSVDGEPGEMEISDSDLYRID